jgi:uncharacterized membrane protein (DUF441 family)
MVLGGSYKEYPIYFVFMILIALIAVGCFDNNPTVIVLSVVALILVYIICRVPYVPTMRTDSVSSPLTRVYTRAT